MADGPFRELGLRALAVGLAVLLWFAVAREPTAERGLQAPLEFENVPGDIEIVGEPPGEVHVRVRGSSSVLSRLQPGEIVAVVDLAAERPGDRLFDLVPEQVRAPFGVEVTQIVPSSVELRLERAGAPRTLPVVPRLEGEPGAGYVIGSLTIDPAEVEVVGPESQLRLLTEAYTEPISIERATGPVEQEVRIGVRNPLLRLASPQTARVLVDIVPAPVERTFHEIPIQPRGLPDTGRATVTPSHVAVSLRGSRDAMRGVRPDALDAFVDLAGLEPGSYNLPVTVVSRPELGVMEIQPAVVRVTLR
jgi:hypothetical protein